MSHELKECTGCPENTGKKNFRLPCGREPISEQLHDRPRSAITFDYFCPRAGCVSAKHIHYGGGTELGIWIPNSTNPRHAEAWAYRLMELALRQEGEGCRAIFTRAEVARIVDALFHEFASAYRAEASEKAHEIMDSMVL